MNQTFLINIIIITLLKLFIFQEIGNVDGTQPKPCLFAKMASLAYPDKSPTNIITPPPGWEIFTQSSELSTFQGGYFGVAFWNRNTNQIIVAHKGTESSSDIISDLQIFANTYLGTPSQLSNAIDFMNKAKLKAAEQGITNPEYYNTGHSLGALLAELVGAKFQTPVIDFESPGGYDFINKFQHKGRVPANALIFAQANTVTYNARPNAINTCNSHAGSTYGVDPPLNILSFNIPNEDDDVQEAFMSYGAYVAFTLQQHGIGGILSLCSASDDWLDAPKLITKWPSEGFSKYLSYWDNEDYWDPVCSIRLNKSCDETLLRNCLNGNIPQSSTCNTNTGKSWGDPHLVTFNGFRYDFQRPGEYFLVISSNGSFQIQVREQLMPGSNTISLNTAVATLLNDTKIEFRLLPQGKRLVGQPNQNSSLQGTANADVIIGYGGYKEIYGYEGDDQLYAGSQYQLSENVLSNSIVHGGFGSDRIFGGFNSSDINFLFGGYGNDYIDARTGNNFIRGDEDSGKVVHLVAGDITIIAPPSSDTYYGIANNTVGYYIKNSTGAPITGKIIWPALSINNTGDVYQFSSSISENQIGYFVITNGNRYNQGLSSGDSVSFDLVNGSWAVFKDGILLKSIFAYENPPAFAFYTDTILNSDGIRHIAPFWQWTGYEGWQCFYFWYGRNFENSGFTLCDMVRLSSNESFSVIVGDTIVCGTGNDTIIYTVGTDGVDLVRSFNIFQDYIVINQNLISSIDLIEYDGGTLIFINTNNQTYGGIKIESLSSSDIESRIILKVTNETIVSEVSSSNLESTSVLFINGNASSMQPGDFLSKNYGFIYCLSSSEYIVESYYGDGFKVTIYSININVEPFVRINKTVSGLLGTNDRTSSNRLILRDGTVLPGTITAAMLYGPYADSWRITPNESLFTYNAGESTYTFDDANFKVYYHTISDYSADAVEIAKSQAIAAGYNPNSALFNDILLEILAGGIDIQVAAKQLQTNKSSENATNAKSLEVINVNTTSSVISSTATIVSTSTPSTVQPIVKSFKQTTNSFSTLQPTVISNATSTPTTVQLIVQFFNQTTNSYVTLQPTVISNGIFQLSKTTLKSQASCLLVPKWLTINAICYICYICYLF